MSEIDFTQPLPSLCEFARVPSKVTTAMPERERREIYQRWIALTRCRLEESLMFTVKKPLSAEVFSQLMDWLYDSENLAKVLPEPENFSEVDFESWSTDLEDLVMESYCWSLILPDSLVTHIQNDGVTLVQGNDLVN